MCGGGYRAEDNCIGSQVHAAGLVSLPVALPVALPVGDIV